MADHLSHALHDRRLSSSSIFEQDEPDRETLLQVISDLQHSEAQALEDYALADRECRRLRREAEALRRQLREAREEDPKSQQIREVLDHWKRALNHPKAKTTLDGARAQKVKARINQGFTVAQLKRAIDGCAYVPYVGPRGRQATEDHGAKRHDDIDLICRDETYVERFLRYADEHEQPKLTDQPQPEPAPAPERRERPRPRRTETPIERVLIALNSNGCTVNDHHPSYSDQWSAQCPAHDDRDPSLSVHRNPDGQVLLTCWAGCATEDVLRALDLEWADLWEDSEHDAGRLNPRGQHAIPSHLRIAMRQILERDERQAA